MKPIAVKSADGQPISAVWTVADPSMVSIPPLTPLLLWAIAPGTTQLTAATVGPGLNLTGSTSVTISPLPPQDGAPDFTGRWVGTYVVTDCQGGPDPRFCSNLGTGPLPSTLPSITIVLTQTGTRVTGTIEVASLVIGDVSLPVDGEVVAGILGVRGTAQGLNVTISATRFAKHGTTLTGSFSEDVTGLAFPDLPYAAHASCPLAVVSAAR